MALVNNQSNNSIPASLTTNNTAPVNNDSQNGSASSPLWLAAYALIMLLDAMQNQQIGNSLQLMSLVQNKKSLESTKDQLVYPPKPPLNGTTAENTVAMQEYDLQCQQVDAQKKMISSQIASVNTQIEGVQAAGTATQSNMAANSTNISNHISRVANLMFSLANICLAWTKLTPSPQTDPATFS